MAITSDSSTSNGYYVLTKVITSDLWNEAIAQSERNLGVAIDSLPRARNLYEVSSFIDSEKESASDRRHDKGTLDKYRSKISDNFEPIERILKAASFAANKVRFFVRIADK